MKIYFDNDKVQSWFWYDINQTKKVLPVYRLQIFGFQCVLLVHGDLGFQFKWGWNVIASTKEVTFLQ